MGSSGAIGGPAGRAGLRLSHRCNVFESTQLSSKRQLIRASIGRFKECIGLLFSNYPGRGCIRVSEATLNSESRLQLR